MFFNERLQKDDICHVNFFSQFRQQTLLSFEGEIANHTPTSLIICLSSCSTIVQNGSYMLTIVPDGVLFQLIKTYRSLRIYEHIK